MSKTVLAKVDGFTPLIDAVVADCGLITAAVFGKVWRYCQMGDNVCKASQERIADELGLSRATVNSHIQKLVDAKYLEDKTPTLAGLPHVYADTGKAGLSISLTGISEPVKKIDTTCQKDLQPPVKNFDTKIVLRDSLRDEQTTKQIIAALQSNGIFSGVGTAETVTDWMNEHAQEWIIKAIEKGRGKNLKYIDKILLDWKANGYPKTREQQITDAKRNTPEAAPARTLPAGV